MYIIIRLGTRVVHLFTQTWLNVYKTNYLEDDRHSSILFSKNILRCLILLIFLLVLILILLLS